MNFKHFLVSLFNLIFVFIIALSISACGTEISSDHILTELYKSGELMKKDIQNIAALRVGYVSIVETEEQFVEDYQRIDFKATDVAPLQDTMKQSIEQDFKAGINGECLSFDIVEYYGKYGDYHIVEVRYEIEGTEYSTGIYQLIVANVFLGYIGPPNQIYVWQEK